MITAHIGLTYPELGGTSVLGLVSKWEFTCALALKATHYQDNKIQVEITTKHACIEAIVGLWVKF